MKPKKEMGEKYKIWIEIQNNNVLFVCVLLCALCTQYRPIEAPYSTVEVHHYGKYILEDLVPKQEVEMGETITTWACNSCTIKYA